MTKDPRGCADIAAINDALPACGQLAPDRFPALFDIAERMDAFGMVGLFHCYAAGDFEAPWRLRRFAECFPGMTVFALDAMTIPENLEQLIGIAEVCGNVVIDLTSTLLGVCRREASWRSGLVCRKQRDSAGRNGMDMNEAATIKPLAFEDAEVPAGIEMRPVQPTVIPVDAYVSEAYARAEDEKLWDKVWQAACRVEEIPEVGDYVTYDIMEESIIVVRTGEDRIQAFYNVCQHRGRQLTEGCGNTRQFICKFHGWRWKINGETAFVNDRKGYDGCLTDENTRLEPVKVDSWGGWLWINMDPDCEPLRQYLEPVATYLDQYQLEKMRYRWRQWLVFPCNWKTALEAFNESHHAAITHPQLCAWGAPAFYWCRAEGKHAWHGPAAGTRPGGPGAQSAAAVKSQQNDALDPRIATAQSLRATMKGVNSCTTDTMIQAADRLAVDLPEGTPADLVMAHFNTLAQSIDKARGVTWPTLDPQLQPETGHDWHIFPNTVVLQGITYALCYRARPNGSDPNSCIFEVYVIERYPEGKEPKTEWVNVPDAKDERWPEVLQQDFDNMPYVQKGMKSRGFKGARPNPRQEITVYNFHKTLAEYMGLGAPEPLRADPK